MTQIEKNIIDKLCPAIQAQKMIKFWYDDKTEDKRGCISDPYIWERRGTNRQHGYCQ